MMFAVPMVTCAALLAGLTLSAAWLPAAAAVPEDEFCSLRSGSDVVLERNWPKVLDALKANPGAFDEVWFSTGIAYPPLDWHEERSRLCARAAADLRAAGMDAAVEIQATIGHVDAGLDRQDTRARTWQTWVGWDGAVARNCSCPRAPGLAAYFRSVAAIYARWNPRCVWIDDDLRLNNRAPSKGEPNRPGCWCDACVAGFSSAEGKVWTREGLLAVIAGGDAATEARWMKFQAEGLASLAKAIAEEVRKVSPATRLGSQFGDGYPEVLRAIRAASGLPVRIRPGSGAYWDTNPHKQIGKAYYAAKSAAHLGCADMIEMCCPEMETCPRTFFCRTPQGVVLEAFEHLACGADCLSMFVADTRTGEDWNYYRNTLFRRIAATQPFLRGYVRANAGTHPCGFSVPDDSPHELVACRGVPIVPAHGLALAALPDVNAIPASLGGAAWQASGSYETQVMQVAAGPDLMAFARQADEACGGRTPILFSSPVRAWALPHVLPGLILRTVAIVNASIDVQERVGVRLRGVPSGASVEWRPLHGVAVPLAVSREGADACVELPEIPAWDCGYLAVCPSVARLREKGGDCPHWISVMPISEDELEETARDAIDQGEQTVIDGIACSFPVHPEGGDPAVDKASVYAGLFTRLMPDIRRGSSVRVGILMQATMGHGGEPGLRTPWQLAVHADGKVTYRFCPLDPRFLDYIARTSRTFSDARPDFFMVDDDTRLVWGKPGCFCPLHLAEFAKRTGRTWTREEVVAKLDAGDRDVTAAWLKLKADSLAEFFRTIRRNYDPSVPGILCVVSDREHIRNAREFAKILAAPGQMPALRGSGAPYHGNETESVSFARSFYAAQKALVGDDVVYLQEADTCPHTRWATTSTRLVNYMTMLALEGVKGAKIWISRLGVGERRSRIAYRKALRAHHGIMEWAAKVDFRQKGFVIPRIPLQTPEASVDHWGHRYFSRVGIPYRIGKAEPGEVIALSGGTVDRLSDAELKDILSGFVLLDGTAAIRLTERGFAADIGVEAKPWTGKTIQQERFADGRISSRALIAGSADLSALSHGAEIRSRLYNRPRLGADFDYVAPGSMLFTNARGGRIFAFAQALTEFRPPYYASTMYSETFRDEVVKAGEELCGTIPGGAFYLGDEPMMLETGVTGEGETVFVMDNLELDEDDAPEIRFARRPAVIERLQEDGTWKEVSFRCDADNVCTLDTLVRTQIPAVFRHRQRR